MSGKQPFARCLSCIYFAEAYGAYKKDRRIYCGAEPPADMLDYVWDEENTPHRGSLAIPMSADSDGQLYVEKCPLKEGGEK